MQRTLAAFSVAPDRISLLKTQGDDAVAIRDLLATLWFVAPSPKELESSFTAALHHPSRYIPEPTIVEVTVYKHKNGETAHTKEYFFTGFEQTAVVLSYIKGCLGLRSPTELARETMEWGFRNRDYRERHPHPGAAPTEDVASFYQDLRVTSVRLAQMAGLLLAHDQNVAKGWRVVALTRYVALRGYVQEPLESLIRTAGTMDWEGRPYREMAFHLLIYAALYQGAARRTEQWITYRYALALQDVAKQDQGHEVPALIVLTDKGTALPSNQWRPVVPQDLEIIRQGCPLPPFPMFLGKTDSETPSKTTWAMVPEAMVSNQGGWCTPDPAYKNSWVRPGYQPTHTPDKALASLPGDTSRLAEICTIEAVLRALQIA